MTLQGGGDESFLAPDITKKLYLANVSDVHLAEVYRGITKKLPGQGDANTRQQVVNYIVEIGDKYFTMDDAKTLSKGEHSRWRTGERLMVGNRESNLVIKYMSGMRTDPWPDDVYD